MTFVRLILKELHCPRCNAIAQLRVMEERGDSCIVYIVCNKCKLKKYHGITTRKAVSLITQLELIKQKLVEATSESKKGRLRARIQRINDEINRSGLGLGG